MGKHRKQKIRANPIIQKEKPIVDEKVRQERVLPIIASLKSANETERAGSLGVLASVIEDPNIRHMLLRERLIKVILSNILSDSNLEIVSQGFGLLRNIVLAEGRDPAVFLIRENVKVPIASVSEKAQAALPNVASLTSEDRDTLSLLIENVCGLTAAIIISAYDTVGWKSVNELAMAAVEAQSNLSAKSIDAAFELLYYSSEDLESEEVAQLFQKTEETISKLKASALGSSTWSTKIYGIGIEFNSLMVTGSDTTNIIRELSQFLQSVPQDEVNTIQVCLELLAIAAQTDDLEQLMLLINEVGARLLTFVETSKNYRHSAISVLNNIGWSLNALEQEWINDAEKVFGTVISHSFTSFDDLELVESALGLLGSTLIQSPDLASKPGFDELINRLFNTVEALYSNSDSQWIGIARSLIVVLAGGGIAAKLDRVDAAGQLSFLMLEHGDIEAQIDALNAMFDIHGDNEANYNQTAYVEKNFNDRLQKLRPLLKRSLKSTPKTDEGLREQALEALTNLDSFIDYKRS